MTRNILEYSLSFFLFLVLFLTAMPTANATHNRAGEITYEQIDNLTIRATVTTYTKASSTAADRDTIEICWGDGTCTPIVRTNGPIGGSGVPSGELLPNDLRKNEYVGVHTYGAISHYSMSVMDPNRNGGICNLNFPVSQNIPFYIRTTVSFFDPIFQAFNSSPILTQPPIDIACIGQPFIHNPGAFDPDGDSLVYELITPFQAFGVEVPKYESPAEPPNTFTMDREDGTIIWAFPHTPCTSGEFNLAFYVIEFRNGIPIDTLIRDMQIRVVECNNLAPQIQSEVEFCVIAGEVLEFEVTATAPLSESTQLVNLTAFGSPFEFEPNESPAEFNQVTTYQSQPLSRTFRWATTCNHIAKDAYTVNFRTADNSAITIPVENGIDTVYLSTLRTVKIKVVGPPPEDLMAEPEQQDINLSWAMPYDCEITEDEYFRGFTVWRRIGSNFFPIDTCEPGLAGRGYTKITPVPIKDIDGGRYVYKDLGLERGRTYCYRVLAEFAPVTAGGFPFNEVESLPSDEICVQLSRDIPLMVLDSVAFTDVVNGEIGVRWTKPNPEDLDTLMNEGPYVYELYRAPGLNPPDNAYVLVPGATFSHNNFSDPVDTFFLDTGLNTQDNPYSYRIAFYINNEAEPLGFATPASSVFLSIASTDEINNLSWEENVPWDNFSYDVFRWNGSAWITIGTTIEQEFSDRGLINGVEYCYQVLSSGSYGIDAIPGTLLNMSQENCGTPLDTIPPCPPTLTVSNLCDEVEPGQACLVLDDLKNTLTWTNPINDCAETDDVVGYRVYYKPTVSTPEFSLLGQINESSQLDTFHFPEIGLAGCYAVTAIDTFFNESALSNIECVDNCPFYELPNAFTPNGDGKNELFIPYPYCFIDRIEIKIFNRWGQLIFETSNPDIQWDGTNLAGKEVVEGVYYYTCMVYEERVSGITASENALSGYIELVRGR